MSNPRAISKPSVPLRPEKMMMAMRMQLEAHAKRGALAEVGKKMLDHMRRQVN
ncbi:MAG: hypothetical protein ABIP20_20190 [Chthoniobacteraceae bacterium]